ncbi:MAG: type II toxin-antitoxin system RelE/ParE family toxin [bacterium]|nr:type II toxin-antitoxin system RelE/ParE family toxin [bacterium]
MILRNVVTGSFRVVAAVTDRGECPLFDFLEALDGDLADDGIRMVAVLERIARGGPRRDTQVSRQIGPGLFEFRKGRIRIAWFYDEGTLVICTHGFVKKTQKTPTAEIHKAMSIHRRYFVDKRNGNIRFEE